MACLLDSEGKFTWVNGAATRLTGYAADELVGRSAAELIAPEAREQAVNQFMNRLRDGIGHVPDESVLVDRNGKRVPIEVTSVLLADGDGSVVLGLVRDLGPQRDAEDALRRVEERAAEALLQSEERFRNAFTFAAIGMAVVGTDGRFIQVNDALCQMVGYSAEELLRTTFQHITHPDDLERNLENVRQLLDGEVSTFQTEKRYVHRLGHEVWLLLNVSLVRASDGTPVHFVSQMLDISEEKAGEARLRELELRYRTLVEQLPLATYIRPLDLGKPNLYVSPQVEAMLGYSVDEWETNPDLLAGIVHPEDRERVLGDAAHLRLTGEPLLEEYRYIHRDGRTVWVQDETYLVREGGEACVQGYLLDITERKEAEEERDRLRDDLHHSQKLEAIGQLAGGIAHDFNNTLTAIRGYGDLLAAGLPDEGTLRRYAEEIRKTAEAAAALPRQLLAFGRRQPLEVASLHLNEVVAESCRLFEPLLGEQIELVFEPGADAVVASDRVQLGQALLNLALNARDAMPDGGRLTVATEVRQVDYSPSGGDYAVVSVRDTGIGMDAETRSRVFEPFFTTKPEGTGLGLAMLYGIVNQSGGFVTVASEPGAGTAFEIHLPCESAEPSPSPRASPRSPRTGAPSSSQRTRRPCAASCARCSSSPATA